MPVDLPPPPPAFEQVVTRAAARWQTSQWPRRRLAPALIAVASCEGGTDLSRPLVQEMGGSQHWGHWQFAPSTFYNKFAAAARLGRPLSDSQAQADVAAFYMARGGRWGLGWQWAASAHCWRPRLASVTSSYSLRSR